MVLCFSLAIWSLGYATANVQSYLEQVLFWRRIAAIGWTSLYSLMLHFLLILTRPQGKSPKKYLVFILNIPAAFSMIIYSFSAYFVNMQYSFEEIWYGWLSLSMNTIWSYFFYGYFGLYSVLSLWVVWKWRKTIVNEIERKSATIFLYALMISMFIGIMTDITLNSLTNNMFPPMGPIVSILPVGAMYYAAKFLGVFHVSAISDNETILTDKTEKKIFYHLSAVFFIGGVIAFLSQYFSVSRSANNLLSHAFNRGIPISSIGITLFLGQQIKNEKSRSRLNIVILLASIPIVTLAFLEFSGTTIWVVPIIIMTSSLVFNNRLLLVSSAIIGVITQRFIWIYKPVNQVSIDGYDYIFRIGIISVTFFLGLYVNKIYVTRIKENSKQIAFQKLNSEISHDLVSINQNNFNEKVDRLLFNIAGFFNMDRSYLFLMDETKEEIVYSNNWAKDNIEFIVEPIDMTELHKYSWWLKEYKEKSIVFIENVLNMPEEAKNEQDLLKKQNVKSLIVIPIGEEQRLQGFIGLDAIRKNKAWSEDQTKQLIILANLLASGLTKLKVEKEIETMAYYDKLTGLPNRVLFATKVNETIDYSKKNEARFSLLFLDLDNFKSVNDTLGHKGVIIF